MTQSTSEDAAAGHLANLPDNGSVAPHKPAVDARHFFVVVPVYNGPQALMHNIAHAAQRAVNVRSALREPPKMQFQVLPIPSS